MTKFRIASTVALAMLAAPGLASAAPVASARHAAPPVAAPESPDAVQILAVVNGAVITNRDVDNRARLFAATAGLAKQSEVLQRLRPQILRQLIDEKLRMQDVESKHIVVTDKQIAAAIGEIEQRNGMQPGALRAKFAADGVNFITLIDQVRTEIGWIILLREQLGDRLKVSNADVDARMAALKQEIGQPEYQVAEIFIPVDDPTRAADQRRFADTVIKQLRAGAPFPVVAAQFSQSQTALQGGDLGWVQASQLDPSVARIVAEMPPGAVSEPIEVPGGFVIAHLVAKRQLGNDMATVLSIRQIYLPFTAPLNPTAPTAQQIATLKQAQGISASVHGCPAMEALAKQDNSSRPSDPGPVRLESVNPPTFRAMLASQPLGQATKPLVSNQGISVMVICSRDEKNLAQITSKDVQRQILEKRVELLSRQMQQDLRRQARILIRGQHGLQVSSQV